MSNPDPNSNTAIGNYQNAWYGYSSNSDTRKNAASGGVVTATLEYLLESGKIDAALVSSCFFKDGKLEYKLSLAKSKQELLDAQTSKYFDIPVLKGIQLIREFDGKVAVVGLPSQITSLQKRCVSNDQLRNKIVFTIALFCGHNSSDELLYRVLDKRGINKNDITEFYYRKGLWRGNMIFKMKDGSELSIPFQEFSHYQNLHFLSLTRCLNCCDHMGYNADLSCGDIWRSEFKSEQIKHSLFLARTKTAENTINEMIDKGRIVANAVDRKTVYLSQMRSINYHYNLSARSKAGKLLGYNIRDRVNTKVKIRDFIAAFIVLLNHKISKSEKGKKWLFRMPKTLITLYVYLFKAMTHYDRKDY